MGAGKIVGFNADEFRLNHDLLALSISQDFLKSLILLQYYVHRVHRFLHFDCEEELLIGNWGEFNRILLRGSIQQKHFQDL